MRVIVLAWLLVSSLAFAQRSKPPRWNPPPTKPRPSPPDRSFDMDPLSLPGKLRNVPFLYFLERANEELERGTLPKRTFVPRLVQSVDDEKL